MKKKNYVKYPNRTRHYFKLPTMPLLEVHADWDDVRVLDEVAATTTDEGLSGQLQYLANRLTHALDTLNAEALKQPDDPALPDKAKQAWVYWRDQLFPKRKEPTAGALATLRARIREGLDLGDWMQIVDWAAKDEWMSGKVNGTRYQEIYTLARSRDQVEKYLTRSEDYFMAQAREGIEVHPYETASFNA